MKKSLTFLSHLVLLSLLILTVACSEDEVVPIPETISVSLHDVGNNNNSSDFRVSFNLKNGSAGQELRIVLIEDKSNIDLIALKDGLVTSQYESVITNGTKEYHIDLSEGISDVLGNPIQNSVSYYAQVISPNSDKVSPRSKVSDMRDVGILSASYSGTLEFRGINNPVDIILEGVGSQYEGDLFLPEADIAHLGALADVSFKIEGDQISDFEYHYKEHIADRPAAKGCLGAYGGDGTKNDDFSLVLNYHGTACEGDVVSGAIVIERLN